MKQSAFSFPTWLNDLVPDDDLFARAYEGLSDERRALIKTGIARLYDYYGPRKEVGLDVVRKWRSGFDTRTTADAVDFVVVLFDGSVLSPARLLAALVPALASGVKHVLAARIANGAPWRKAVLTGLELAGQEFVVDLNVAQARQLFGELRDSGHSGAVVVLGPKAAVIETSELQAASRISFWRPRFNRTASIWLDDDSSINLESLSFIHPDIQFSVYGSDLPLPADNFSYKGESFSDLMDNLADVAYLPADRAEAAVRKARLVLGPGQEGCWTWPELHPEHFQFHTTVWTSGE